MDWNLKYVFGMEKDQCQDAKPLELNRTLHFLFLISSVLRFSDWFFLAVLIVSLYLVQKSSFNLCIFAELHAKMLS